MATLVVTAVVPDVYTTTTTSMNHEVVDVVMNNNSNNNNNNIVIRDDDENVVRRTAHSVSDAVTTTTTTTTATTTSSAHHSVGTRPKLRNKHSSSSSTGSSSSSGSRSRSNNPSSHRSMIGSFRLSTIDHVHVCESCDTTTTTTTTNDENIINNNNNSDVDGHHIESSVYKNSARSIASLADHKDAAAAAAAAGGDTTTTTYDNDNNNNRKDSTRTMEQPVWTRTTFVVQNVCCASEVPIVRRILRPYQCRSVGIAITTKRVTLVYNPTITSTDIIRNALTDGGFPARMVATELLRDSTTNDHNSTCPPATNAASSLSVSPTQPSMRKIKASSYVESTVSVTTTTTSNTNTNTATLQRIMKQNFSPSSVRACHIIVSNNHISYVKIEHHSHKTSIASIMNVMTQSGYNNVTLVTDGATERLYLPEIKKTTIDSRSMMDDMVVYEDESNNSESIISNDESEGSTSSINSKSLIHHPNDDSNHVIVKDDDDDDTTTALRMELHIILSGLFWAISMIATLAPHDSTWRYMEYTGILSVLFGLPPVLRKAINTLRRAQFDANCMMSTAAIGACILGEWDEAASVSFLFSVSDYMEARASSRARRALEAIIQLRPDHASVIDEVTKDVTIVPATHVPLHALLSVRTGDKITADGIVVEGTSSIDQSSLTGESMPVHVSVGSIVSGGSINIGTTQLHVRTTASVQDSAVSRLIRLVEDAQSNRSPTEKLVDTFARAYTPAIVGLAAILASVPWLWGTEIGRIWTLNALILIVIACPCALTISTPVTYAAGLAATAQRGIVCKGGATLEALGSVRTIIFDKTGTLTEGKFVVTNLQLIGTSHKRNEMLALLALMEIPSSHPLSTTLLQAVKSEGVVIPTDVTVKEHTLLPGEGVTAIIDSQHIFVGNCRLFERLGMYQDLPIECKHVAEQWEVDQGGTVGFIGIEGVGIIGSYSATDVVRPEAKETVQSFLSSGFNVIMLTGDCEGAAKSVARQVGLPESAVYSQLLPEDKLSFVTKLKSTKTNDETVEAASLNIFRNEEKILFCGDGVNDAPALAFADVGISMGEGAALAMEMSDVTLMDSNLSKLLYVVQVGSRVLQTIRENIIISLLCKILVIGLTFGGYMTLLLAIASDVGVMLLVTLNGMKLLPRNNAAVVSLDDHEKQEKSKSPNRFRRVQRYERISTDMIDSNKDDNVEMV